MSPGQNGCEALNDHCTIVVLCFIASGWESWGNELLKQASGWLIRLMNALTDWMPYASIDGLVLYAPALLGVYLAFHRINQVCYMIQDENLGSG